MSFMKSGMLLAAGGLAGLVLAAILEAESERSGSKYRDWDDDDDDDEEEYPPRRKLASRRNDDLTEKSGQPSLDGIVKSVKADAEAAMAACQTDEEREDVYEKVSETVRELQATLSDKGEEIIDALRAKAESLADDGEETAEKKRETENRVLNLRETANEVASALDEVLANLKLQTT